MTNSQIAWTFLQPDNLALALLLLGLAAGIFGRGRLAWAGKALAVLVAGLMLAATVTPLSQWAARRIEAGFERTDPPAGPIDGILVLGGGAGAFAGDPERRPRFFDAADRLIAAGMLARAHPEARIVYLDAGLAVGGRESVAAEALRRAGVPPERAEAIGKTRTTYENLVAARAELNPACGETWLLVTSAWHMRRALGVAKRLGWPLHPYPVDHRAPPAGPLEAPLSLAGGLDLLSLMAKEWVGALYYALRDRAEMSPVPIVCALDR